MTEETTTKRKRGRPRKEGGPKKKPVVLDHTGKPRGRGRPRKNPDAPPPEPKTTSTPASTGRGRGRPRKNVNGVAATATAASTATADKEEKSTKGEHAQEDENVLRMMDLSGNYSLECPAATADFDVENLRMRIVERGDERLLAAFDLGIIRGVMLLAPSKEELHEFEEFENKNIRPFTFVPVPDEDEDEDSGPNDDEDDDEDEPPAKKAKTGTKSKTGITSMTPLQSRRVYFKWQGKEPNEGQIYPSTLNYDGHAGYLEFTDDSATEFVGYGGFPALGEECKFTGTKLKGLAGPAPRWDDYSQKAADEANISRWK